VYPFHLAFRVGNAAGGSCRLELPEAEDYRDGSSGGTCRIYQLTYLKGRWSGPAAESAAESQPAPSPVQSDR